MSDKLRCQWSKILEGLKEPIIINNSYFMIVMIINQYRAQEFMLAQIWWLKSWWNTIFYKHLQNIFWWDWSHMVGYSCCTWQQVIDNNKLTDTVYCKSFEMEKFCRFRGSIGKRKTFTVKHFHLVIKMVGHGWGSSLKNSCDLLCALGKVSGIMLPS